MVTKAFKKELMNLSPYQLTMAVKEWMENNGARLQLTFNWDLADNIPEEFEAKELLILRSIEEKPEKPRKKVNYVKLKCWTDFIR